MSYTLRSFAELSWEIVELRALPPRDIPLALPVSTLRTLLRTEFPLVIVARGNSDPDLLERMAGWHHGGINE